LGLQASIVALTANVERLANDKDSLQVELDQCKAIVYDKEKTILILLAEIDSLHRREAIMQQQNA
jgi:hypothetical protein